MSANQTSSNPFRLKNYLTDGGLETTLIFHHGIKLNSFSAFELLQHDHGRKTLMEYYQSYLSLAKKYGSGFVLETPTWRSNSDWGYKLGYTQDMLFALNKQSLKFMRAIAQPYVDALSHVIISGNIGPRGDGYKAENKMTSEESKAYHFDQVRAFALGDADVVTALTLTYSDEAIGIIRAARSFNLPVVISFTVETDGRLPGGETLQEAIDRADGETDGYASHFMINCAHPQHFLNTLMTDDIWKHRIHGIRANASCKSHAELDESHTLDSGDKQLLSQGYIQLNELLPNLKVIGGCCGTDASHFEVICEAMKTQSNSKRPKANSERRKAKSERLHRD